MATSLHGNFPARYTYLDKPPAYLHHLLFDIKPVDSKNYQKNTRVYNTIRLHGQPCHRIGSLLPVAGEAPKLAQLYIYDTDNEVANRIQGVG
jgi:hypothetical protein